MKIGVVSQWYPPEPVFVPGSLADELVARGHEVRVLTSFPSYPGGHIYPGWRQRWQDTTTTGALTVRRVPQRASHGRSAAGRMVSYLSFAATSTLAALRYLAHVDALYVYHPPATTFAAAAALRRLRRTPTLLHVQDVWPEAVTASGLAPAGVTGRFLAAGLTSVMRRLYQGASAIAVTAPSMQQLVVERGAAPERVRTVLNWTDESIFRPVPVTAQARAAIGHRGRCTVMFAGNMGRFQHLETAVRAAAAVRDHMDLVLVGSGVDQEQVIRLAGTLGASNVRFLARRPPEQMAELYAAADYQLVCLRDLPALRATIPSKLQAALCCGSPVVAAVAGDAARLVETAGVGLTCPPEDWQALADRFSQVAGWSREQRADLSARALRLYRERMALQVGVDQIEDMLMKMTHEGARR
ncbi:glycosyltransferase family 4 protein [Micromonospora marina]|uniref:Glycosyltransferase involved in cell wall bisynthesis n=1 Tax=Micromonospora marina TaxID=307120 RepID=A0A1C4ZD91_9ACTN|nr:MULTISPECIES: glycosyltransferase family 4 protein [Micromonospora]SCF30855.1 Glycosyltransferase involved in cell wall bisynthesis [Micromonospora marina]